MSSSLNRYVREREERLHHLQVAQSQKNPIPDKEEKKKEAPTSSFSKSPPDFKGVEKNKEKDLLPLMGGSLRNLSYSGPLRPQDLDLIEKNYPSYREAQKQTGVNWRVLAAIHLRESDLSRHPLTHNNPFQLDGVYLGLQTGNLLKDTVTAGRILQAKTQTSNAHYHLQPVEKLDPHQVEGKNLEQALFRYNGPIYGTPEKSPYVMNGYDKAHENMKIYRGKTAHPQWGVDHRLGVLTTVRELVKAFPER